MSRSVKTSRLGTWEAVFLLVVRAVVVEWEAMEAREPVVSTVVAGGLVCLRQEGPPVVPGMRARLLVALPLGPAGPRVAPAGEVVAAPSVVPVASAAHHE
jgi:hypothetical protein